MTSILLADTVTALGARHRGCVLVAGSHGGIVAAHYAACAGVRAVIFNDAGVGLDAAGIAGLSWLDPLGIAAATVSHRSARIAIARESLAHGVISAVNRAAARRGVAVGDECRVAARKLCNAEASADANRVGAAGAGATGVGAVGREAGAGGADVHELRSLVDRYGEGRHVLAQSPRVVGCDSIGQVMAEDAGTMLVIGSHCELHGGDPASALPVDAAAAFFHDAGYGAVADACSRLPVLAERAVPAAAVGHCTARIGDARSMWVSGVISVVNSVAAAAGLAAGMRVREAVARIGSAAPKARRDDGSAARR